MSTSPRVVFAQISIYGVMITLEYRVDTPHGWLSLLIDNILIPVICLTLNRLRGGIRGATGAVRDACRMCKCDGGRGEPYIIIVGTDRP